MVELKRKSLFLISRFWAITTRFNCIRSSQRGYRHNEMLTIRENTGSKSKPCIKRQLVRRNPGHRKFRNGRSLDLNSSVGGSQIHSFIVRTLMCVDQQGCLPRALETLDINECCIQETHIRGLSSVISLSFSPSPSVKSHLRLPGAQEMRSVVGWMRSKIWLRTEVGEKNDVSVVELMPLKK